MKRSLIAVAVLGAFAGAAHADDQKNQTVVYGVIDAAVRYSTNALYSPTTGTASSYTGMSQGLFNGSRFGVKGTEDLGNGSTKAIYDLEAGLVLGTGASDQQGQLFGRQAWAGLADDTYGSFTVGRQYGNFSGAIGTGDVFGELHGNEVYGGGAGWVNGAASPNEGDVASENGFMYSMMGYRWDNSLLYANKVGPVKFSLMHSFQGQTSNTTSGNASTMNSVALGYVSDDLNVTVGYQKETDAQANANSNGTAATHTDIGFGANYQYGDKAEFGGRNGVYGYYMDSKFDAGFTRVGLGTNSEFSFNTTSNALLSARQDKVLSVSTNYYVTPRTNVIVGYYHDTASNVLATSQTAAVAASGGTGGSRNGILAVADYYFSKNTDTYVMAAHTTFKGALIGNSNGGLADGAGAGVGPSSTSTVMLGMRHRF
ncbi:MAG TPA: porin [Gallionellaceae bacterium]|nr:porin [Gallionellaceae bacterium]